MYCRLIAVSTTLFLAGIAQGSETIRCGRWVVDDSVSVQELVKKCGEPASKRSEEQDVRTINRNGASIKVGTTIAEYWTYDRGRQAAPVLVIIIDGKVHSIERIKG